MGAATDKALQKLQAMAQYGVMAKGATPAAAPDPRIYGVFGPSYAGALAADTGDISGPGSRALLEAEAGQERRDYKQALTNAQLGASMLAKIQAKGATGAALANQLGTEAKYGILGHVNVNDDGSFDVDPVAGALSNDLSANERAASAAKDRAASFKDLHDAGATFAPETVQQDMSTNPGAPVEKGYGVFAPKTGATFAEQATADHLVRDDANGAVNAGANATRAAKGGAADGQNGLSISVVPGMFGMPDQVTQRMKGPAAAAYMAGHGGGAVPASSPLQARIAAAKAAGSTVVPMGDKVKIVGRSGQSRVFNADGSPAQ